ncbi:DUF4198 domain-containing protein [Phenylobacterium sp.]|uniref:DUF4198 domain-containing protein n=1 Tax=Phenylobacterium sp. TaxID=1871053 RepID=UPI002FCABD33
MNRRRMGWIAGVGLLALAAPGAALAHMPYLLPNLFDTVERDHVTVQASFTEEPFVPEVVMKSEAFHVLGANGRTPITAVTYLRDLAVFEAAIPAKGTFRISSGERFGRKGKMFKAANGRWEMTGEGAERPAGVELVDVQSMTLAEVYVSRGAPTSEALAVTGKGLELKPITHPSAIFAGQPARFELSFDGKPVSGADVEVYRSAGTYDGRKKLDGVIRTDAKGGFALTPPDAGTYLALIRHRTTAPAGAETPYRSYSYTLTFEATE